MGISHSPLKAPAGNRQVVSVTSGLSDSKPLFVELVSWDTEKKEPQELEVLVYPLFEAQELDPAANTLPTFFCTRFELTWSGGAGEAGSAQAHSTTRNVPPGVGVSSGYADRDLPLRGLPDHGIRMRVACRSLRVRVWIAANPASFVLVGSIQPCVGGHGDVVPRVLLLQNMPQPIPIGAREFRVAAFPRTNPTGYAFDPTCLVQFNECRYPSILGTDLQYVVSDCLEWRAIPGEGEAYSFQTLVEAYGTIEFR